MTSRVTPVRPTSNGDSVKSECRGEAGRAAEEEQANAGEEMEEASLDSRGEASPEMSREMGPPSELSGEEAPEPERGDRNAAEGAAEPAVPPPPEPVHGLRGGRGPRVRGVTRPTAPTLHEEAPELDPRQVHLGVGSSRQYSRSSSAVHAHLRRSEVVEGLEPREPDRARA